MIMKNMKRQLLSIILIATMVCVGMANGVPKQTQAAINSKELAGTYLSDATRYLYLGGQGNNTYDFNIKKEARKEGATYFWYVVSNKETSSSVAIDKKPV